jgi:hypothetical protein
MTAVVLGLLFLLFLLGREWDHNAPGGAETKRSAYEIERDRKAEISHAENMRYTLDCSDPERRKELAAGTYKFTR